MQLKTNIADVIIYSLKILILEPNIYARKNKLMLKLVLVFLILSFFAQGCARGTELYNSIKPSNILSISDLINKKIIALQCFFFEI